MDDLLRLTDQLATARRRGRCPFAKLLSVRWGSNSIDLGIDSVAVNVRLLWVEADFFRVFRYAFTEEAEFAKVEAAFHNDEPVSMFQSHRRTSGIGRQCILCQGGKSCC